MKAATVLVVASHPDHCPVCAGRRRVRVVSGAQPLTGTPAPGVARCPHCADGVPVAHIPIRVEHPRGGVA